MVLFCSVSLFVVRDTLLGISVSSHVLLVDIFDLAIAAVVATFASVMVPFDNVVAVLPEDVVTSPVNAGMSVAGHVLLVEIFNLAMAALAETFASVMELVAIVVAKLPPGVVTSPVS